MIISADIGGTKTSIGLSRKEEPINYVRKTTYLNSDFESFIDIVKDFSSSEEIEIMVLGIAGPISGRIVDLTNLDWTIDADALQEIFTCEVFLLNDLEAAAHTLPHLTSSDIEIIYHDTTKSSLMSHTDVIVSVGTGLGVAKIYQGKERIVFASEGGHIGFSPKTEFQHQFFDFINQNVNHVSTEFMVSSIGFKHLREYILDTNFLGFSESFLNILKKTSDISRLFLKTSKLSSEDAENCQIIIREFSEMLGSFLGDMVLVHLPRKIYLTGGIGRNIPEFTAVRNGLLMKSNMTHVVEKADLSIITNPDCALHGTSWFAAGQI